MRSVRFPVPPPTPEVSDEPLLSMVDAAKRLGIARDTLKRMARRGEITSVKLGKLRRFEPSVIRAYIAQHRVTR